MDQDIQLLISKPITNELQEVLKRGKFEKYRNREEIQKDLSNYLILSEEIETQSHFEDCRDAKDNKFLDLAVEGKADFLITGDKDLLVLNPFRNVRIVKIDDFFKNYSTHNFLDLLF